MKKFKVRYIIILIILLVLFLNEGARTVFRRHFEVRRLNAAIENAKYQNTLLKKRIYYIENEPAYLERMARADLGVIAPDEIEYRFSEKQQKPEEQPAFELTGEENEN
jgi:cell division protein FtsB